MKNHSKAICTSLLLFSITSSSIMPVVKAQENNSGEIRLNDGTYSGFGGGYHSIEGNVNRRIPLRVTFKNNQIENVEVLGVELDPETDQYNWKENPDDEDAPHEYGDNPEYLKNMNAKGGEGALKIVDLIKEHGLNNIDNIISELRLKYKQKRKYKNKEYNFDVVTSATASSIGIAEAIKEAMETAMIKENRPVQKPIDRITFIQGSDDLVKDNNNKTEIVLRGLEGEKTRFEGLKVRIDYTDATNEEVSFKDFDSHNLELVQILANGQTKKIDYKDGLLLDTPNQTMILSINDKNSSKSTLFKLNVKSLEYIPINLEYTTFDGGYGDIELAKEDTPEGGDIIFSDILAPLYRQTINIKSSDLGNDIYLRTRKASHEKSKEVIDTYVVSGPIRLDRQAAVGNVLSIEDSTKGVIGRVRPYSWNLTIGSIVDDKNEQVEKLKELVAQVESNKELMDELKKEPIQEKYVNLKEKLTNAKNVIENISNQASNMIRSARQELMSSINEAKGIDERADILNEINEKLPKLKEIIDREKDANKKLQKKSVYDKINTLLKQNKGFEDNENKLKALNKVKKSLDDYFNSQTNLDIYTYINADTWQYNDQSSSDEAYAEKARDLHGKRIKMAKELKALKDEFYSDDANFYLYVDGNDRVDLEHGREAQVKPAVVGVKSIFDEEESEYIEEAKTVIYMMGLRDSIDSKLRKANNSNTFVETNTFRANLEALNFMIKDFSQASEVASIAHSRHSSGGASIAINKESDKNSILEKIDDRVSRLSGSTRYETSIKISKMAYEKADKVYIVSGENMLDSLSVSSMTKNQEGPILLLNDANIDSILKEISRLGAKEVVIVGGEKSLTKNSESKISNLENIKKVLRISGNDRYETSIKLAKSVIDKYGNKGKVIVVSGENPADAVSISAYASKEGIPVILANKNGLGKNEQAFLKEYNIKEAILVGGTSSVKKGVEDLFEKSSRIAGKNRFETSAKLAEKLYSTDSIILSNGINMFDAMGASYYAAMKNQPIILLEKDNINKNTQKLIAGSKNITILGGENSVSSKVKDIK